MGFLKRLSTPLFYKAMWRPAWIAAVFAGLTAPVCAEEASRYALVIGNSSYQNVTKLPNAARDAEDIANALVRLQFRVYRGVDLTKAQFAKIVGDFKRDSESADTIVFYYAGHGFQLNKSNYLVPIDADLTDIAQLDSETQLLNDIINKIHGPKKQTAVLLDACRNNPLPKEEGDENIKEGLAEIQSGFGSYIAFATEPGLVSKDGLGSNSPFTRAILDHISTPKQSISDLMIAVRNEVYLETREEQKPWDTSSLKKQFYFNPTAVAPPANESAKWIVASAAPEVDESSRSVTSKIEIGIPTSNPSWIVQSSQDTEAILPGTTQISEIESPTADSNLLTKDIQSHLKRLNCSSSNVDGVWGSKTARALQRVSKNTGITLSLEEADSATLDSLKALAGPLCVPDKPTCGKSKKLTASGKCVAIADAGKKGNATGKSNKGGKSGGKSATTGKKPIKPETSVGGGIGVGSFF